MCPHSVCFYCGPLDPALCFGPCATEGCAAQPSCCMEAPPNYGEQYAIAFRQVFRDLAKENKVPFVPFLLEGIAGVPQLNQEDGIHPTSAGAARIAEHLWPAVETMIAK